MATVVDTLLDYTSGKKTLEETQDALKDIGSSLYINVGGKPGNALLDCGVGSLEPIMVVNGKLENPTGVPHQDFVYYGTTVYQIDDDQVTLIPADICKDCMI